MPCRVFNHTWKAVALETLRRWWVIPCAYYVLDQRLGHGLFTSRWTNGPTSMALALNRPPRLLPGELQRLKLDAYFLGRIDSSASSTIVDCLTKSIMRHFSNSGLEVCFCAFHFYGPHLPYMYFIDTFWCQSAYHTHISSYMCSIIDVNHFMIYIT